MLVVVCGCKGSGGDIMVVFRWMHCCSDVSMGVEIVVALVWSGLVWC